MLRAIEGPNTVSSSIDPALPPDLPTREAPMTSEMTNRREFTRQALQSLTAVALIEGLAAHNLFGRDVSPIIDAWFKEMHGISSDLKDHKIKDIEFQKSLEALYRRVDLTSLLKTLDFDRMA